MEEGTTRRKEERSLSCGFAGLCNIDLRAHTRWLMVFTSVYYMNSLVQYDTRACIVQLCNAVAAASNTLNVYRVRRKDLPIE